MLNDFFMQYFSKEKVEAWKKTVIYDINHKFNHLLQLYYWDLQDYITKVYYKDVIQDDKLYPSKKKTCMQILHWLYHNELGGLFLY